METISLTSERLIIRQLGIHEYELAAEFANRNRDFFAPFDPIHPESYFTNEFWKERISKYEQDLKNDNHLEFFIFLKKSQSEVVGRIRFSGFIRGVFQACYLGYAIGKDNQGQGIMTEALGKAIQYIFEKLNLHRVMANYIPGNIASEKVLKKLGFQKEGLAKDYLMIAGIWQDHILTSLINREWKDRV